MKSFLSVAASRVLLFFFFFLCGEVRADNIPSYFVSTKSDEVNVRAGPNIKYPVKWKILRLNEPLKVIKRFEHWRNITDSSGDGGWVHVSNISAKLYVKMLGTGLIGIYEKPNEQSKIMLKTEADVLFQLLNCTDLWCRVEKKAYKGWVKKENIWGVD